MMKKKYISPNMMSLSMESQHDLLGESHVEIVNGDDEKGQRPDNNPDDFEVGAKKFDSWTSWDE